MSLQWEAADTLSGLSGYSWTLDHSPSTTPDQTIDGSGASTVFGGVADGEWYAHVRCRDEAGNWSAASHRRILIDTGGPTIEALSSPTHIDEARWYASNDPAFTWSAEDAAGVAGYCWTIDQQAGGAPGADLVATAGALAVDLPDGIWYIHVSARDVLGQDGASVHRAVRIDTHGPSTFALSAPSVRRGAKATLRYKVTDPLPNGGAARVRIEIRDRRGRLVKGTTFAASKPLDTVLPWKVRCGWAKGTYRYRVLGWDAAGNPQVAAGSNRLVVR